MRELASGLLSGYAAVVATGWLAMVMRRSRFDSVRGLAAQKAFSNLELSTSPTVSVTLSSTAASASAVYLPVLQLFLGAGTSESALQWPNLFGALPALRTSTRFLAGEARDGQARWKTTAGVATCPYELDP
jgi:hypothetical protein